MLHAIHDFLPRYRAGSEIYALALARALARRHHVTILCAEYDPARAHGEVVWRMHDGLPVVELINNWICGSFADTYRPPVIGDRLRHVLRAVRPDVAPRAQPAQPLVRSAVDGARRRHSGRRHAPRLHARLRVGRPADPSRGSSRLPRDRSRSLRALFRRVVVRGADVARRHRGRSGAGPGACRGGPESFSWRHPENRRGRPASRRRRCVRSCASSRGGPRCVATDRSARRAVRGDGRRVHPPRRLAVPDRGLRLRLPGHRLLPDGTPASSGRLRIGYVGSLVWHKGIHVLHRRGAIAAGVRVRADDLRRPGVSRPNMRLGCARPLPGCPSLSGSHSSPKMLRGCTRRSTCSWCPSLWLENSPLVIHEAYQSGRPVIGSRIGGIAELVREGWDGLLFEPGSSQALGDALRRVIAEPAMPSAFASRLPRVKAIADDCLEWEARYAEVIKGTISIAMTQHRVSIVIPTRNGAATLPAVLDAIWRQRVSWPVETIAIDSGSTDGTIDQLKGKVDHLIQIAPHTFDHGLTRNLGVMQARGDFVVLMVQDAVPVDDTWLEALTTPLAMDERLAGTFARQLPAVDASATTRHYLSKWVAAGERGYTQTLDESARARHAGADDASRALRVRQRLFVHPPIGVDRTSVPRRGDCRRSPVGARRAARRLLACVRARCRRPALARSLADLRVQADAGAAPPAVRAVRDPDDSQRAAARPVDRDLAASPISGSSARVRAGFLGRPRSPSRGRSGSTLARGRSAPAPTNTDKESSADLNAHPARRPWISAGRAGRDGNLRRRARTGAARALRRRRLRSGARAGPQPPGVRDPPRSPRRYRHHLDQQHVQQDEQLRRDLPQSGDRCRRRASDRQDSLPTSRMCTT